MGQQEDPPTGALLGNSLAYAAVLTIVLVPLAWIFRDQLGDLFADGYNGNAWAIAALGIPISFLDWTTHNQVLGALRFGYYNALLLLQKLVYVIAVILLVRVLDSGVSGVFLAGIAGSLLVIGGSLRVILARAWPKLDLELGRRLFSYGARTQVGGIFQYLNSRFDVIILQFFRPLSSVGYYVIAESLAELVMVITRSFQSSIMPLVTRDVDDDNSQETRSEMLLRHHGVVSAFALIVNAFVAPFLILFAYGSVYYKALLPFFIILPGIWFLGSGLVIANDLNARNRPGLSSTLSGLAVCLTVVFDLILIPPFGVPGAAVASLIAYTVFGIASFVTVSRLTGIRVRNLVPRRSDFALYVAFARRIGARVTSSRRAATGEDV